MTTDLPASRTGATDREVEACPHAWHGGLASGLVVPCRFSAKHRGQHRNASGSLSWSGKLTADELTRLAALLAEQPGDHSARESVSHSSFPKSYTREGRARAARNGPGESGVICSDCGWLVGGPNAHPNAEAQHRQHLAEQPGGGR